MSASQDKVQGILQISLEETLPLVQKGIFTSQQLQNAMCVREKFENNMLKPTFKLSDYLRAIQFEYQLERRRRSRLQSLAPTNPLFKKQAKTDFVIVKRIIKLWDRTMHKFKYNIELWKQYIDFCIKTESKKQFYKALSTALRFLPFSEDLWLIGVQYEIEIGFNLWKARKIFIKALRMNSKSISLWTEMFKFEIKFLKTLSEREKAIQGNQTIQFITGQQNNDNDSEQQKMRDQSEEIQKANDINLQEHDEILYLVYTEALSKLEENDKEQFMRNINNILTENIREENDKTVLDALKKAKKKISSGKQVQLTHQNNEEKLIEKDNKKFASSSIPQKVQYYQNYLSSNKMLSTAELDKIFCQFLIKPNQLAKVLIHFLEQNPKKAVEYVISTSKLKVQNLPPRALQKFFSILIEKTNDPIYKKFAEETIKKINSNSYIEYPLLMQTVIKFNKKTVNFKINSDIHRSISILCKNKPQIIEKCLHAIHHNEIKDEHL